MSTENRLRALGRHEVPQQHHPRFAPFDGLRAIAVVLVFAHHLMGRFAPGGWIGVDLFFALSGYLITRLLLAEYAATGRINLRAFYTRRALRLFPALIVFIAVVTPVAMAVGVADSLRSAVAALTYTMNFFVPVTGSGATLSHTWSLAAEEQFYLLWPLFLTVGLHRRWKLGRTTFLIALLGIVIGAVLSSRLGATAAYHSPFPHLPAILGGSALALAMHHGSRLDILLRSSTIPIVAALEAVLVTALLDKESEWLYYGFTAVLSIPFILLIGHLVVKSSGILAQTLSIRPLVWLGQRSYGFYLWHFPVTWVAHSLDASKAVAALFAVTASVALTILSWHVVEIPFLKLKSRFASVST